MFLCLMLVFIFTSHLSGGIVADAPLDWFGENDKSLLSRLVHAEINAPFDMEMLHPNQTLRPFLNSAAAAAYSLFGC